MFPFATAVTNPVGIAGLTVGAAFLLLWLLRRMRVRAKYLVWTLAAHAAFIALLGLTIAPTSTRPRDIDAETIAVVMLPPLREEVDTPEVERAFVRPATMMPVVPPAALPRADENSSRSLRLLGSQTSPGLASARLDAIAPRESPADFGAFGLPTRRSQAGELRGTSVTASPTEMTEYATGGDQQFIRLSPRGNRVSMQMLEGGRDGTRVDVPGPDVQRTGEIDLPSGYSIKGEVGGREISYLPQAPEVHGTDAGTVKVKFWVSADGRVYDVHIIEKGGPQLDQAARRWVERLQFSPLDPNANPTPQFGELEMDFSKFR